MACIKAGRFGKIELPDNSVVRFARDSTPDSEPSPGDPRITVVGGYPVGNFAPNTYGVEHGKFIQGVNYYIVSRGVDMDDIQAAPRISGERVRELPEGSYVIEIFNGEPFGQPVKVDGAKFFATYDTFVVLVRADEKSPEKGDQISGTRKTRILRDLPEGSIVVDETNDVARKQANGWRLMDDGMDGVFSGKTTILRVGYDN